MLWVTYLFMDFMLGEQGVCWYTLRATSHLRAKSRDHDIMRAQKKVSKGRPNTPPKSCHVVADPQVHCEGTCDQTLNQMLFH